MSSKSSSSRWRPFAKMRPSYIVLVAILPLIIFLFLGSSNYKDAIGFIAPGLLVTIFVTICAYLIAGVLGLGLASLLALQQGKRTIMIYSLLVLGLLGVSSYFFTRPHDTYVLLGETDGRVGIVQGTPERLSDIIKAGSYSESAEGMAVRGVESTELALERLASGNVSAIFIPKVAVTAELARLAPLWEVSFLPSSARNPALSFLVFAFIIGLLTFAGWQTGHHPLEIFAELYVDTLRGIPMLVIILYVGFPLQGALRDITNGVINMSRLARGIVGISLGYAAYMAEVFRAGIQAIPKGQFEAARSLGLSGWQTAFYVILPQALKIVIPPLGNEFVAMLKDTSLLSILSVRDITQRARELQSSTFIVFPSFNTVAILYICLTLGSSSILKFIERINNKTER